jgi:uncharacterized lipoprotein YajG
MTPTYARISLPVLLLMLVATLAGCALNPLSVLVTYQRESNIAPVAGASLIHVQVVGEDQRADKTSVGQYDQQPIVAGNNVIDTARDAVQSELQARGFVIDSAPANTVVRVQVLRLSGHFFSSLFFSSYTAELIMHVEVERPGKGIAYSQSFDETDTYHPSVFANVSDDFGAALSGALQKGVAQLLEDPAFMAALLAKH